MKTVKKGSVLFCTLMAITLILSISLFTLSIQQQLYKNIYYFKQIGNKEERFGEDREILFMMLRKYMEENKVELNYEEIDKFIKENNINITYGQSKLYFDKNKNALIVEHKTLNNILKQYYYYYVKDKSLYFKNIL